MEDELNTNMPELPTEDGTYTELVESTEVPKMTDEEADNREYEEVEIISEEGL